MACNIIGISAFYHDSAAALLIDGNIDSATEEERFTRKKGESGFPVNSIAFCMKHAGLCISDIDYIVFYDKPLLKFERIINNHLKNIPRSYNSFVKTSPLWLKEKLFLHKTITNKLKQIQPYSEKFPPILFSKHHRSHAASAYYPSPFNKAVILCMDGVGEWDTTTVWIGENNNLTLQWSIEFPHSIGLLYSAFTYFCGFKVNSGEYKLMGLAPYGKPIYQDLILTKLVDVKPDGTYHLNMDYFDFGVGNVLIKKKFHRLFGGPPRTPESAITQREMDIASSIQAVTEYIILKLAKTIYMETHCDNLCLAGGVALNCVANSKILAANLFKDIWIQPASNDAGGALGAAYDVWHRYLNNPKQPTKHDKMNGAYLGPSYTKGNIKHYLNSVKAPYEEYEYPELLPKVAKLIADGNVIGWFQGKMEFGPRALGNRSILGDPRRKDMQSTMNLKIKYRESFRPFAPAVKFDLANKIFEFDAYSPYMLLVANIQATERIAISGEEFSILCGIDKLKLVISKLPAITHVDYSSRLQTVHPETNKLFYDLISEFEVITGYPVLINTSFNVRGEPIVCTPEDAYRCFMMTEIDYLVLENILLQKNEQPLDFKKSQTSRTNTLD